MTHRNPIAISGILAIFLGYAIVHGSTIEPQSQIPPPLSFEVANVKPFAPGPGNPYGFGCRGIDGTIPDGYSPDRVPQGRCVGAHNLRFLISYAYGIDLQNISGGPAWATSFAEGFQLDAAAEDASTTTKAQLRGMLQALLTDRFKLKVRRETKEVQGYALVIGRSGSKLKEVGKDALLQSSGGINAADRTVTFRDTGPIESLVQHLSVALHSPVLDKTELKGIYDFSITYPMGSPLRETSGPSIFTTIQELGLRLDSISKVPIEVIVIDSAEKPSGN